MANRLTGVLSLTALLLAGALAAEIRYGTLDDTPIRAAAPGAEEEARVGVQGEAPSMPPLAAFAETLERPLFSESRRPAESETLAEAPDDSDAARPAAGGFLLSAVVITDESRVALLRGPESRALARLREGETLDGWSVAEIRADSVLLRHADETQRVPLRRFGPGGAAAERASQAEARVPSERERRVEEVLRRLVEQNR